MKPICVPCRRFYRPHKNGRTFVEAKPISNRSPSGLEAPELWIPYKLWMGDLWRCEGCGSEIIVGVGHVPISQDYHTDFEDQIKAWRGDEITINDC